MATITQFEDLPIWQEARSLCKAIQLHYSRGAFARHYDLVKQISSSSGSCMDNIAEGFERDGKREFIQFLSISKASIGETRSQLYRAFDFGYIPETEFHELRDRCLALGKDISNFMRYLERTEHRGNKFKARDGVIN